MTTPEFVQRLEAWLVEQDGIEGARRVVRSDERHILVSKFEAGFAARLHESLASLPALFSEDVVAARYQLLAAANPGIARVACWHKAAGEVVESAVWARDLTRDAAAEVLAGVDSVAALMDSVLWSSPRAGGEWAPSSGETAAFGEALARMDDDASLFTRYYGTFEGRAVVNHCPGAAFARRLFAQAWEVCTGDIAEG